MTKDEVTRILNKLDEAATTRQFGIFTLAVQDADDKRACIMHGYKLALEEVEIEIRTAPRS